VVGVDVGRQYAHALGQVLQAEFALARLDGSQFGVAQRSCAT
jgi:hypothetical protein